MCLYAMLPFHVANLWGLMVSFCQDLTPGRLVMNDLGILSVLCSSSVLDSIVNRITHWPFLGSLFLTGIDPYDGDIDGTVLRFVICNSRSNYEVEV